LQGGFAGLLFLHSMQEKPKNQKPGIRLNKFLAHGGVASRRKADELIRAGKVTVNGKTVTEMGYLVQPGDQITCNGKPVRGERFVYILMNKPKDFLCTRSDEKGRKTVIDLLHGRIRERVYPVGRLDRNTTGLLLLTNDGDLAQRLAHPSGRVEKLYHVRLDRDLAPEDLEAIRAGLELEDGFIRVDQVDYVAGAPPNEVGVRLHSGRNRIIRRIFEHLGYRVKALDRVKYAGLTKKDLPRGKWRLLASREIGFLKQQAGNKSKTK